MKTRRDFLTGLRFLLPAVVGGFALPADAHAGCVMCPLAHSGPEVQSSFSANVLVCSVCGVLWHKANSTTKR
jgi:hypothetical protein